MLLNSSVEACFWRCVRVTGCTYSWMTHRVWGLLEIYNNQLNLGKSGADRIFTFGMWGTGISQKKQKAKKDSVTPLLTSHLQQNALQSRMSQRKWHPGGVRCCLMKKTAAEAAAAASSAHRSTFSTWSCSSSTSSSPCKGYPKPTSTTTELARTFLR